jgi:hypothetical protein
MVGLRLLLARRHLIDGERVQHEAFFSSAAALARRSARPAGVAYGQ